MKEIRREVRVDEGSVEVLRELCSDVAVAEGVEGGDLECVLVPGGEWRLSWRIKATLRLIRALRWVRTPRGPFLAEGVANLIEADPRPGQVTHQELID